MAQQSVRRGLKNQYLLSCFEHVCLIWIRSANSHAGQQPELRKLAGQMAASDQPLILKITACLPWGVHRRANGPLFSDLVIGVSGREWIS